MGQAKSIRQASVAARWIVLLSLAGCGPLPLSSDADAATGAPAVHSVDVLAGCAVPRSSPAAHAYYVDPVRGDMRNDGSARSPWRTLEEVVKAGLISTQRYPTPYQPGAAPVPQNPKGVIKSGDVIYLRSGNHGVINLFGAVNGDFISVEAEAGQNPVLTGLHVAGASKWVFKGLTIQNTRVRLVEFLNHNFHGPTDNIVFEGNHVQSQPDVSAWSQQDWVRDGSPWGITDQATCALIKDNELRNIGNGMVVSGAGALVEGNVIDNFGDDGVDVLASRVTLRRNRITNNHDIGDGNHNDGIQGWTLNGATNRDILIEGNTIIVATDPALPFRSPAFQGISIFDGKWENVQVRNNVVISDAWHGIALYGIRGAAIINNTVIGVEPRVTTWIGVFDAKKETGGAPSESVAVHNNIAGKYNLKASGIVEHHNVTTAHPEDHFVKFDVAHARYDMHLSPRSSARGAGSAEKAPKEDLAGKPRVGPVDAGAYAATAGQ